MHTNAVELIRDKLKITWAKVVACFIGTVVIYNIFFQYCNMSIIRETPDRLVNGSIDQVIGRVYTDNRCLTRKEVILTVSDLFFQLKQEGFEKTEDPNVTIGQALIMKVLKGDDDDYHLKDQAKKEEALAFIGRSLGIPDYLEPKSIFPEEIDCSDWAKRPIEKLIEQGFLSVNEIMGLGDLRQTITVSDLKFVLGKVAEIQIDERNSWRVTVLNAPFSHTIVSIASLLLSVGVVAIMEIVSGKNHNQRGEEQNQQKEMQQGQEEERENWEAARASWKNEQEQWEAARASWKDEQEQWEVARASWKDEQEQWEAARTSWEDEQERRKKSEKGGKKSKNNRKKSGKDGKKKKGSLKPGNCVAGTKKELERLR